MQRAERQYTPQHQLAVTLHFLAHCPTIRALSTKFDSPPSSVSRSILCPTLKAIRKALFDTQATKNVRFPRTADDFRKATSAYEDAFGLPGAIGAIDGTLVHMRKPTRAESGGDNDAFWCYKGHIASLLLAICDAQGRFIYINAGAPGTCGDAGLWFRTQLRSQIQEGCLEAGKFELRARGQTRILSPYLVGDSAFALTPTMMKCYDGNVPETSRKGKFNRRLKTARRGIEQAFGRLKGRWQFAAKNLHYSSPSGVQTAIIACCVLHNFLEFRDYGYEEQGEGEEVVAAPAVGDAAPGAFASGETTRDFLTSYCVENAV